MQSGKTTPFSRRAADGAVALLCCQTEECSKSHINFIGNVEGRDVFIDKADVMVCEGFTGNIILKLAESLYDITQRKNIRHEYFDRFNFENYGGTPVLGVNKPVVIGHGISQAKSFKNMIVLAQKMIEKNVMQRMKDELV